MNKKFEEAEKKERKELLENNSQKSAEKRIYPLVVEYNPKLPPIKSIITTNLNILYTNQEMKKLFPEDSLFPAFKRAKNLKNKLAPSIYGRNKVIPNDDNTTGSDERNCDLCRYVINAKQVKNKQTGETLRINHNLNCNSKNVIYLINDKICKKHSIGSALDMKKRFRNHKSHIKNHRETCNLVRHWWEVENHKSTHSGEMSQKSFSHELQKELELILVDKLTVNDNDSEKEILTKLHKLEGEWQVKMHTFHPYGLNIREEYSRETY